MPSAMPDQTPRAALRAVVERALAQDVQSVARLRYARTSVAVVTPEEQVTVLLDRHPPVVGGADEPAEITLELTAEQGAAWVQGTLPLPAAVATGTVRCTGPVRKLLLVEPILRDLLRRAATDAPPAPIPAMHAVGVSARPDAQLLSIETSGLYKAFDEQQVLGGVDLAIPEGVISVILGPSGTGKSVLLQHILGLLAPDAGDILIRGRALSSMSRSELLGLRSEIGVMFQDGALFSAMNVYDNVAFPLRQHTDLEEHEIRELVEAHLEGVGLAGAATRMPNQLSGGMKKRAGLARALVLNPGIVLCDEPDSGLDPVRTALLGELLVEQHAAYGGTMVVVTHNVMLARRIADHVSVLWKGRVLEAGMAAEVFASDTAFVRQFLAGESQGPLTMDA